MIQVMLFAATFVWWIDSGGGGSVGLLVLAVQGLVTMEINGRFRRDRADELNREAALQAMKRVSDVSRISTAYTRDLIYALREDARSCGGPEMFDFRTIDSSVYDAVWDAMAGIYSPLHHIYVVGADDGRAKVSQVCLVGMWSREDIDPWRYRASLQIPTECFELLHEVNDDD